MKIIIVRRVCPSVSETDQTDIMRQAQTKSRRSRRDPRPGPGPRAKAPIRTARRSARQRSPMSCLALRPCSGLVREVRILSELCAFFLPCLNSPSFLSLPLCSNRRLDSGTKREARLFCGSRMRLFRASRKEREREREKERPSESGGG